MSSSAALLSFPTPVIPEVEPSAVPAIKVSTWIINFLAIVIPFLALIVAICLLWGPGFSGIHLGLLLGMYVATGLGVTIGFHRLLTHRAFETTPAIKGLLAILGSMTVEGPVLVWVATHRRHHQHSDQEDDPHSPHIHGGGFVNMLRGLWHAHAGWILRPEPQNLSRYVGDFREDGLIQKISALFTLWVVIGLIVPAIVAGLWTMTWWGALLGFIWGGLVRVFLVHHITWSINSACHLWGSRPFQCGDQSRNNFVFGVLAWGEGWHNNHHAFPTSARHGLWWWQIDLSYLVIQSLAWAGLAWNIRKPSAESIALRQHSAAAN